MMKPIMLNELLALEQAIATLEALFQSLIFENEEQAKAVRNRLMTAERRLGHLTVMCSPEDDR